MEYLHTELLDLLYDLDFRRKFRANPQQTLRELGYDEDTIGSADEWRIITNTKDTMYVPMPKQALDDAVISRINAAGARASSLGSAGTAGTLSSIGTECTTVSTGGTIGTVSTAGSAVVT